jgi:hypothetical protein
MEADAMAGGISPDRSPPRRQEVGSKDRIRHQTRAFGGWRAVEVTLPRLKRYLEQQPAAGVARVRLAFLSRPRSTSPGATDCTRCAQTSRQSASTTHGEASSRRPSSQCGPPCRPAELADNSRTVSPLQAVRR